jgi:hypothetical protein
MTLKACITNYYKNLCGATEEENFSMGKSRTYDFPQVSDEESTCLTVPYMEDELKGGFQMKHNMAKDRMVFRWSSVKTFGGH